MTSMFTNLVRSDLCSYNAASNLAFNEKIKELNRNGLNIAHFAFGESPFPVPQCLTNALKEFAHRHEYLPMNGISSLRDELSAFHQRNDGVVLSSDGFIVGPGSKELIYLTMTTFNGDIIIPSPAWTTYAPQTTLAAKKSLFLHTEAGDRWKIHPKKLQDFISSLEHPKKNKILILTNPGNPTGVCYNESELEILSDVCRRNNIIVLSDEIYARLTFSGKHKTIAQFYPEGTILTSGFSKWASAGGWRIGYAHFPEQLGPLRDAVRSGASHTYSCAAAPMQYAAAKCLKENHSEMEKYADNCRIILKSVGDYCYRQLIEVGVGGVRSEACFYYLADFEVIRCGLKKRGIINGQEMVAAILEEAQVALMSSEAFLRPATDLTTRFCFVWFDGGKILADLKDGLIQLGDGLDDEMIEKYCQNLVGGIRRLKKWVIGIRKLEEQ